LVRAGRFGEAASTFARAVEIAEHQLGPTHPHTLTAKWARGGALFRDGKREDAEALFEQVRRAGADDSPALRAAREFDYLTLLSEAGVEPDDLFERLRGYGVAIAAGGPWFADPRATLDAWIAKHEPRPG
jgi:hypothetical protein